MPFTGIRFTVIARFRRIAAVSTLALALALGAGLLAPTSALASSINHSLPVTAGHTCVADMPNTEVFCIEVGVYTSAATGQSFVTAQVETICQNPGVVKCSGSHVSGEVANGGGARSGGSGSCVGDCQSGRNFFYPLGGFLIGSSCLNNLWGVVEANSTIDGPSGHATLNNNVATPHFNYCPGKGFTPVG